MRSIIAATGPIGLLIAAIGLVVKYLVDTVKRGIELRRELGTSAVATAKIQVNMEKAAFAAAMYGGTMQQGRDAVKALVVETGRIDDITGESAIAMGKFVANTGLGGGEAAKSGNVAFVEAGNNFADLLQKVNAGDAGPAEIAQALATTDFGKFEGSVKEIFETMKKTPSLQSILKVKS